MSLELDRPFLAQIRDAANYASEKAIKQSIAMAFEDLAIAADRVDAILARDYQETFKEGVEMAKQANPWPPHWTADTSDLV